MNPEPSPNVFVTTAAIATLADQVSKFVVFGDQLYIDQTLFRFDFSANFYFAIETTLNRGAVAGIGQDMNAFFALLSALFLVLMVPFFLRMFPRSCSPLSGISAGLAWGGVMGNFIDRIAFGAVRDFITVAWWPTFNIADSCICIGVLYFVYVILFDKHVDKKPETA
ncbi:MAG: lipoprotein signal peptidase LspA [Planctomycetota bacterium]